VQVVEVEGFGLGEVVRICHEPLLPSY
jgi:hypothetical protein